jgi:hypothetical protein
MASVDEVKNAIEDVVPGRSKRGRRLPVALLLAAIAAVVAFASRLGPVRSGLGSAVSGVRGRVASMRGGGAGTSQAHAEAWPATTADSGGTTTSDYSPSDSTASELAATDAAVDAASRADTTSESPVGVGFDDAAGSASSPETIPADTEEGRPSGV